MKGARQPKIGLWLDTSCTETSLAIARPELLTLRTSSENALDFIFTALDSSLAEQPFVQRHHRNPLLRGPWLYSGLLLRQYFEDLKALRPKIGLYTSNSLLLQTALLAEEPNHPKTLH